MWQYISGMPLCGRWLWAVQTVVSWAWAKMVCHMKLLDVRSLWSFRSLNTGLWNTGFCYGWHQMDCMLVAAVLPGYTGREGTLRPTTNPTNYRGVRPANCWTLSNLSQVSQVITNYLVLTMTIVLMCRKCILLIHRINEKAPWINECHEMLETCHTCKHFCLLI